MVSISHPFYIKIKQMQGTFAPIPYPDTAGFIENKEYFVLGIYSASETSEGYLILINENNQIWYISHRHTVFSRLASEEDLNKLKNPATQ